MRRDPASLALIRRALRDRFDPQRALVITASPRSGSTLLGQVVSAIDDSVVLFEPMHRDRVPPARDARIGWRPAVAAGVEWPEGEHFFQEVFSGNVVNDWTARETTLRRARRAEHLIVKFVRANRCLPWLADTFSLRSPVLLVRHPCAVVASQTAYDWSVSRKLASPPWLAELPGFADVLDRLETPEERRAATWALDLLPAFLAPLPHPWLVVTYEDLLGDPSSTLARIADAWGVEVDPARAAALLEGPSSTVAPGGISGLDGWRRQLDSGESSRVLDTVHAFGLTFYGDDVVARDERLDPASVRAAILSAGT